MLIVNPFLLQVILFFLKCLLWEFFAGHLCILLKEGEFVVVTSIDCLYWCWQYWLGIDRFSFFILEDISHMQ